MHNNINGIISFLFKFQGKHCIDSRDSTEDTANLQELLKRVHRT